MSTLRFVADQAWQEFRAGCRGPLVAIVFPGLIAYVLIVILNADYLRDMGGTDVPRNSPHLVYLMTAGQATWVMFVWAWLFGQVVVRDRAANLHEVVLSTPISLASLFAGRYLGALALGSLLTLAGTVGFLLVPLLGALGVIPPDAVGPQPWFAIAHSFVLLVLPSAAGLGALFLCAALRTRSIAGPFAVAAVLVLVWMVAMIVVRGGDANPVLATVIDPSAFAEAEEQSNLWTPREKAVGVLELTPALIANRLTWTLPPLLLLGIALRRIGRERLTLEKAPSTRRNRDAPTGGGTGGGAAAERPAATAIPPATAILPVAKPSWFRATWNEAAWHFRLSFRGWGTPFALFMLAAVGVGGSFVHIVMHADGPLRPRPDLLQPMLVEFFYLIVVFMVAAFVGVIARRDDRTGWSEIGDTTSAPVGVRVAGRALASLLVTLTFALTPAVSVWIVNALAAPEAFSLTEPLRYFGLLLAPPLLELAALVLLAHAVIRHAGAAHATGIICAFFVVVNHELGVNTYPPAEFGVPVHVTLSEFAGWAPWLRHVATADVFKLALVTVIVAAAWLAWPRGAALTLPLRWRTALGRVATGAGALAAAGVLLAVGSHAVLHEQFVRLGGYLSAAAETEEDADWEKTWWDAAAPFSLTGGEAWIHVDPDSRIAIAHWRLHGVQTASGTLHGSLPHGSQIGRAAVDNREVAPTVSLDHFSLALGDCGRPSTIDLSAGDRSGGSTPQSNSTQATGTPGTAVSAGSTQAIEAGATARPATEVRTTEADSTRAPESEETSPALDGGCRVEFTLVVRDEGWSAEGETAWLHSSGVWLRAADVLPTLGHDPDRLLRAPSERRAHELAENPVNVPAAALTPSLGVAPAGNWRWSVQFASADDVGARAVGLPSEEVRGTEFALDDGDPPNEARGAGQEGAQRGSPPQRRTAEVPPVGHAVLDEAGAATQLATAGRTSGPLDFAVAWWPDEPAATERGDVRALHGRQRARDAAGVLDDVVEMRSCVARLLGDAPPVRAVLQAPRERGATAVHGDLLWLPEHEGWDAGLDGFARWRRRATIAAAFASRRIADAANLRKEPGEDWLRVGVPGWVALECVRSEDGSDAWLALQSRASDQVVEALGALDAPARSVAAAGDADWIRHYTPLATVGWAESVGHSAGRSEDGSAGRSEDHSTATTAVAEVIRRVREGEALAQALAATVGSDAADSLLGPPASSDVHLTDAERTLEIGGQRWLWREGGWTPLTTPIHVAQRYEDGSDTRRLIGPVPTTAEPETPFTLIDAWPSFERTPIDNVWRGDRDGD